jgi:aminopeptidase
MKDPRLQILADNLLDYSLELQPGEKVLVRGEAGSVDLLVTLVESAYARGGVPFVQAGDSKLDRAWLLGAKREQMDLQASWNAQRIRDVDASIFVLAGDNASQLADVPGDILEASHLANREVMDLYLARKWVLLRYPTPSAAQAAGMSSQSFEDFCLEVSTLDYARMDKAMDPLVELMARTDQVRIVAPGTDLLLSIKGIPILKAAGKNNIPDGEVYTAPIRESVNGTIAFNTPSLEDGVTFERIRLTFENGRVTQAEANEQERLLRLLDTDEGARYLGEFALGVNPRISRPMKDTLYDEKIGGSLHVALGRAYEEADNGNRSSIHWDIVLIQTPQWGGGEIYFDNALVRKDGLFVLSELDALNPDNLA